MANIYDFFNTSKITISNLQSNPKVPKADVLCNLYYQIEDIASSNVLNTITASIVSFPVRGTVAELPTVVTVTPDAGVPISFTQNITEVTSESVVALDSVEELKVGSSITVGSETRLVSSISALIVTLSSPLSTLPTIGDTISYSEVVARPSTYSVSFTIATANFTTDLQLKFSTIDGYNQTNTLFVALPKETK